MFVLGFSTLSLLRKQNPVLRLAFNPGLEHIPSTCTSTFAVPKSHIFESACLLLLVYGTPTTMKSISAIAITLIGVALAAPVADELFSIAERSISETADVSLS